MKRILLPVVGWIAAVPSASAAEPIRAKVVVVAMFESGADTGDRPGEFQLWVEREKLTQVLPFPQGYRDLRPNADGSVLGVVTGVGTAKSAATIMALGLDPAVRPFEGLQSLAFLARAKRVDVRRVPVLRTAGNFDMQWPGGDAAESLSGEKLGAGYSAYLPALEASHRVGSPVMHELIKNWARYEKTLPGAK